MASATVVQLAACDESLARFFATTTSFEVVVAQLTFVTDDIVDESVDLVVSVPRHIIDDGGYLDNVDKVFLLSLVCLLLDPWARMVDSTILLLVFSYNWLFLFCFEFHCCCAQVGLEGVVVDHQGNVVE